MQLKPGVPARMTVVYGYVHTIPDSFCLAYLRGRRFHPKIPRPPPPPKYPNILLSLQYLSNCIGKVIQTRRGQRTWSKYSLSKDTIWQGTWSRLKNKIKYHCNISQNCVSMNQIASWRIFISKKIPGVCPRIPLGCSRPSATLDFSPKR